MYRILSRHFGPQRWWPARTPLEVIVGAVLVQNTSWTGVEHAVANLSRLRLLQLDRLVQVQASRLAGIIRPAGCSRVKARRLLTLLHWLKTRGGLDQLRHSPTSELRAELLAINGVGPETADSILLYALHRPVFVVGAYTRRILTRYGLMRGDEDYEKVRVAVEKALPHRSGLYGEFHALLVRLGKTHCRPVPKCDGCPLE